MTYEIHTDLSLARPLDEVFAFFADAANLEAITPPELRFRIESPLPIEMKQGALIVYRLSLYGVPFRWRTEISEWNVEQSFVDRQLSGPFALWVHEHRFEELEPGVTRVRDGVHYRLPFGPLGRAVHPIVRSRLNRIFQYRSERVAQLLGPGAIDHSG